MTCTVVNKYKEPYDVYIGRGTVWGNPHPISDKVSRLQACLLYIDTFISKVKSGEITYEMVLGLQDKRLGCFCRPEACHGLVILKAVKLASECKNSTEFYAGILNDESFKQLCSKTLQRIQQARDTHRQKKAEEKRTRKTQKTACKAD
jgi:hypothetical protein